MSEKMPLEGMEEMVNKLSPIKKKRKTRDKESASDIHTVDQEQGLANLLDGLITTDPCTNTTNHQPTPSTTDEKKHNLNVCPFHE